MHFIAINDGVDNHFENDSDFMPFRNIINEWYAKDTSKKVRAVFKAKGNSGKHLCTCPPYGYKKDESNKEKWIVDEEAAKVVKEIFSLCMKGYAPPQAKPKSNTKVFGLGFSFAKIQYVSAFLGFWQTKVALLRCSYGCVRIPCRIKNREF